MARKEIASVIRILNILVITNLCFLCSSSAEPLQGAKNDLQEKTGFSTAFNNCGINSIVIAALFEGIKEEKTQEFLDKNFKNSTATALSFKDISDTLLALGVPKSNLIAYKDNPLETVSLLKKHNTVIIHLDKNVKTGHFAVLARSEDGKNFKLIDYPSMIKLSQQDTLRLITDKGSGFCLGVGTIDKSKFTFESLAPVKEDLSTEDASQSPTILVDVPKTISLKPLNSARNLYAAEAKVVNNSQRDAQIKFTGSCSCFKGAEGPQFIKPGSSAVYNLKFEGSLDKLLSSRVAATATSSDSSSSQIIELTTGETVGGKALEYSPKVIYLQGQQSKSVDILVDLPASIINAEAADIKFSSEYLSCGKPTRHVLIFGSRKFLIFSFQVSKNQKVNPEGKSLDKSLFVKVNSDSFAIPVFE